jgi:uncharacterized membrane protein YgdD (TMEM256/DUF423 family)
MLYDHHQRKSKPSLIASFGGLLAAAAIALGAYAAHGQMDTLAQSHLQTATLYAFGHGIALAALGRGTHRRLGRAGLFLLLLGTLLFSGSLVLNTLANVSSALAPVGGVAMIVGWLVWALDSLRR